MNIYSTDSTKRKIEAESWTDAAEIAAGVIARREYGRKGRVAALRCDGWAINNSWVRFEAFIGRKTGQHETSGRNVWFTVFVDDEDKQVSK